MMFLDGRTSRRSGHAQVGGYMLSFPWSRVTHCGYSDVVRVCHSSVVEFIENRDHPVTGDIETSHQCFHWHLSQGVGYSCEIHGAGGVGKNCFPSTEIISLWPLVQLYFLKVYLLRPQPAAGKKPWVWGHNYSV